MKVIHLLVILLALFIFGCEDSTLEPPKNLKVVPADEVPEDTPKISIKEIKKA